MFSQYYSKIYKFKEQSCKYLGIMCCDCKDCVKKNNIQNLLKMVNVTAYCSTSNYLLGFIGIWEKVWLWL